MKSRATELAAKNKKALTCRLQGMLERRAAELEGSSDFGASKIKREGLDSLSKIRFWNNWSGSVDGLTYFEGLDLDLGVLRAVRTTDTIEVIGNAE